MKRFSWLVAVFVSLVAAPPLYAKKGGKKKRGARIAANDSYSNSESYSASPAPTLSPSAAARSKKSVSLGLRAGGVMGLIGGAGVESMWYQSHRFQLGGVAWGFGYDFGGDIEEAKEDDTDLHWVDTVEGKVQGALIGVQTRYFFGNSFYLGGGLGQRILEYDFHFKDRLTEESAQTKGSASSTVAMINLGNLWSFHSGFYIGADWVGITSALASSYKASTTTNGLSEEETADVHEVSEDLARLLAHTSILQFTMLNVGWAF